MTKKATILLILIALTISLSAQDIVTIEECQRLAVAQSSANVQKEFNEQLLHVKLNDVSSHYYPTLEINGALGYISPVPELPEITPGHIDMRHDVYNATLNLQQVVFDGLQATYGRKRERLLNKTEISPVNRHNHGNGSEDCHGRNIYLIHIIRCGFLYLHISGDCGSDRSAGSY